LIFLFAVILSVAVIFFFAGVAHTEDKWKPKAEDRGKRRVRHDAGKEYYVIEVDRTNIVEVAASPVMETHKNTSAWDRKRA
jgi:hypothetical protein